MDYSQDVLDRATLPIVVDAWIAEALELATYKGFDQEVHELVLTVLESHPHATYKTVLLGLVTSGA